MATNVNFKQNNEKKDKHFKKFILWGLATLISGGIGISLGSEGGFFLIVGGITGLITLYNFIMYRYNK